MNGKIIIDGGKKIIGDLFLSGSKNITLPIIAASVLCSEPVFLSNIPNISDVRSMLEIACNLGGVVSRNGIIMDKIVTNLGNSISLNASNLNKMDVLCSNAQSIRASILLMGSILTKYGKVKIANPGGCKIGSRPINFHLQIMEKMGANIEFSDGFIKILAPKKGLKGAVLNLPISSVGATQNAICAAVLAYGETIINNAAKEPEVSCLINFLQKCGAKISGSGSSCITISGSSSISGCSYQIPGDRIEAGTYAIAAAITGGKINLRNANMDLFRDVCPTFERMGISLAQSANGISVETIGELRGCDISTAPYPDFPTDLQAPMVALLSALDGVHKVEENIFESRFAHTVQLNKMSANIVVDRNLATVYGKSGILHGAEVEATDLRAAAALIVAGLAAKNTTVITNIHHLDRGYYGLEEKLRTCGANIFRINDE